MTAESIDASLYRDLMGVRYVEGGRDEDGVDCWGLLVLLLRKVGVELPTMLAHREISAELAAEVGDAHGWSKLPDGEGPRAWDLFVHQYVGCGMHVGIMATASHVLSIDAAFGVTVQPLAAPILPRVHEEWWRYDG